MRTASGPEETPTDQPKPTEGSPDARLDQFATPDGGGPGGSSVQVEFRRDLRLLDITMIGIGAMIGAGIFVLIGIASGYAGPACIIAFLLNGIINTITAMTYAELGSAYPEAGGGYLWVRKGLPPPFGFVSGWISWFGHTVACALYASGFGTYMAWMLDTYFHVGFGLNLFGLEITLAQFIGVAVAIILLFINFLGTASTGKSENIFTLSKLVILGIFIAAGGVALVHNPRSMDNLMGDFFPEGGGGILFAMGLTLIAFQGYEVIAQTGEEVKDPMRNIPKAIFVSLAVVVLIYVLMVIVLFGMLTSGILCVDGTCTAPHEWLGGASGDEGGEAALIRISEASMGIWGAVLILVGGYLSTLSALNATIFSSSRVAFAMGRDGTLPKFLGNLHLKRRTPHNAIAFSGLILILMVLFFPIKTIAGSADVMFLILFSITNSAGIALRYKMPELKRGFRVPLFPILPVVGIILNLALIWPIFQIEPLAFYIGIIWIMIGAYIFFFTGAQKEILEAPIDMQEMPVRIEEEKARRYRVLVPLKSPDQRPLVKLGALVARARKGDLSLLHIHEIPKATPASRVAFRDVDEQIKEMEELEGYAKRFDVDTDAKLLISHEIAPTIVDISGREDIEFILLGWHGYSKMGVVMGTNLDQIVSNSDADVAIFKFSGLKPKVKNVMLLHGHAWHVSHAADLAALFAKEHGASVSIVFVSASGEPTKEDKEQTDRLGKIIRSHGVEVSMKVAQHSDSVEGILYLSKDADILFMGATEGSAFGRTLFGDLPDRIAKKATCPVVILRKVAEEKPIDGIDRIE